MSRRSMKIVGRACAAMLRAQRIGLVHEVILEAEPRQHLVHQAIGATVEVAGQHDVEPVVIAMHYGLDAAAGGFRRRIDVSHESNRGSPDTGGRGNGRHHDAVLVDLCVAKT